jgi:3-dehydroquinate dehydratase
MVNETQNKPIEQIQKLEQFLPNEKQGELVQILAFGEKHKADSIESEHKFWSTYGLEEYKNLLLQYESSKQKFLV